jgi:hypothetical protein
MTTTDTTTATGTLREKGMESSTQFTTADNSILEKPSPAPASIHSNENTKIEEAETNTPDDEDETQYPPMLTKVGVGIGLALAVFLVLLPPLKLANLVGRVRSDNSRNCNPQNIRPFPFLE